MINIFVDETCELTNDVFIYTCSVVIQTFIILVAPNNYHTSFEIDKKTAVITQIKDVTKTDILTIMVIVLKVALNTIPLTAYTRTTVVGKGILLLYVACMDKELMLNRFCYTQ
jgi:hypothetical protein